MRNQGAWQGPPEWVPQHWDWERVKRGKCGAVSSAEAPLKKVPGPGGHFLLYSRCIIFYNWPNTGETQVG